MQPAWRAGNGWIGLSRRLMLEETEWVGRHGGKEERGKEGKGRRKGRRKGKRQRGKWRGARPPGVGWGGVKRQHFPEGHPSLHPQPVHTGCWRGTLGTYLWGLPAPVRALGPQPGVPLYPHPTPGTCSCWGVASSPGVAHAAISPVHTAAAEGLRVCGRGLPRCPAPGSAVPVPARGASCRAGTLMMVTITTEETLWVSGPSAV